MAEDAAKAASSAPAAGVERKVARNLSRKNAAVGTQGPPVRFSSMKVIDADESRAQAKHCRELAMSTKDAEIELLFLQTAEDLERQADRLETFASG